MIYMYICIYIYILKDVCIYVIYVKRYIYKYINHFKNAFIY